MTSKESKRVRVEKYGDMVAAMSVAELEHEVDAPEKLKFACGKAGLRRFQMAWAPFDPVNKKARVAVFGITPGRTQMGKALRVYRQQRIDGSSHWKAAVRGKKEGAFSGDLRARLVRILDEVALPEYLGIPSSASLWGLDADKVHFSSCLRWPVFVEGKNKHGKLEMQNYTGGAPSVTSVAEFKEILRLILAPEIESLSPDCLIAPLGTAATKALSFATNQVPDFDRRRLLVGLPHPAGSANDVSSQFLGDPPSPSRTKALNPAYRHDARRLRAQVLDRASYCAAVAP